MLKVFKLFNPKNFSGHHLETENFRMFFTLVYVNTNKCVKYYVHALIDFEDTNILVKIQTDKRKTKRDRTMLY